MGGYVSVHLYGSHPLVHQLVLLTFVGPCPDGYETRHKNGKPSDNRLENLQYGTPKQNDDDRTAHGTRLRGEHHGRARLTPSDIANIRNDDESYAYLARKYGIAPSHVVRIKKGISWKHTYVTDSIKKIRSKGVD